MEPRTYPRGNYNVICDICGRKIRRKEAMLVTDKYSTYYNFLVCKKDFDKTNPQASLKAVPERNYINPKYIRPALPDFYATDSPDVLPSAPLNLRASVNPLEDTILLQWDAPIITGGRILGYTITKAEPQLAYQFTIEEDTGTELTTYEDLISDVDFEYTYSVAAINALGTGAYSALAFFPAVRAAPLTTYLVVSQSNFVLTTGDGTYFITHILVP